MKKKTVILVCMLVYSGMLSDCMNDRDSNLSKDSGSAVEVDIDTEEMEDTDRASGDSDIEYEFKDPENTDGIEIIPKE